MSRGGGAPALSLRPVPDGKFLTSNIDGSLHTNAQNHNVEIDGMKQVTKHHIRIEKKSLQNRPNNKELI